MIDEDVIDPPSTLEAFGKIYRKQFASVYVCIYVYILYIYSLLHNSVLLWVISPTCLLVVVTFTAVYVCGYLPYMVMSIILLTTHSRFPLCVVQRQLTCALLWPFPLSL